MQTTKDLLLLIDTGRDVRQKDVLGIRQYVKSEYIREMVLLIKLHNLPKGTPKNVAKSLLLVGLATGYLSKELAEMYSIGLHDAWKFWNTLEIGL